jgi:hypothetical protein
VQKARWLGQFSYPQFCLGGLFGDEVKIRKVIKNAVTSGDISLNRGKEDGHRK